MKRIARIARISRNAVVALAVAAVAAVICNKLEARVEFHATPEALCHARVIEYVEGLVVRAPELKTEAIEGPQT